MTTYMAIKSGLDDGDITPKKAFHYLKGISELLDKQGMTSAGQDLLIRILSKDSYFKGYENIIISLLRKSGLMPYMAEYYDRLEFSDKLALEYHRSESLSGDVFFNSVQLQAYSELMSGKNVILSASTSLGKSMIIDAILGCNTYNKVVIVVPTLALIDETRKRLKFRFGNELQIITHKSQAVTSDKVVFVLTQERVIERDDLSDLDLLVIDEFYKLDLKNESDTSRATLLNLAFYSLNKYAKQFYLLGPNIDDVIGLDKVNQSYVFLVPDFQTVAVDVHKYNLKAKCDERYDKLTELLNDFKDDSSIIYCQSPNSTSKVITRLLGNLDFQFTPSKEVMDLIHWLKIHFHPEWNLVKALEIGIGIHHANIPRAIQQHIVHLFNNKKINHLVCTSTLIEGVNTVAKHLILFDRRIAAGSNINYFTFKNISGRAGRMFKHLIGHVHCLEEPPEKDCTNVDIPIGTQGIDIPDVLLLHFDELDLSSESKSRLSKVNLSILDLETMKANIPYDTNVQHAVASRLVDDLSVSGNFLDFNVIPNKKQREYLCILIFDYLEGNSLRKGAVYNSDSLSGLIGAFIKSKGYSEFIQYKIISRDIEEDISDVIQLAIKQLRNVIGHTIPKALMTLDRIINSVFKHLNIDFKIDLSVFVNEFENYFLPPAIAALDEYGVPIQIAEKYTSSIDESSTLDEALDMLHRLDKSKLAGFHKAAITFALE